MSNLRSQHMLDEFRNIKSQTNLQPRARSRPPLGYLTFDLTGKRFGRLTAVAFAGYDDRDPWKRRAIWHCECSCGGAPAAPVRAENLFSGQVRSCGCLRRRGVPNPPRNATEAAS
jgi:hypothetical protein